MEAFKRAPDRAKKRDGDISRGRACYQVVRLTRDEQVLAVSGAGGTDERVEWHGGSRMASLLLMGF